MRGPEAILLRLLAHALVLAVLDLRVRPRLLCLGLRLNIFVLLGDQVWPVVQLCVLFLSLCVLPLRFRQLGRRVSYLLLELTNLPLMPLCLLAKALCFISSLLSFFRSLLAFNVQGLVCRGKPLASGLQVCVRHRVLPPEVRVVALRGTELLLLLCDLLA